MNNIKKFKIEPCYELEIGEDYIKVFSYSKYRKGIKKELSQYRTNAKNKMGVYLRVKLNNKHHLIHQLVATYCIGPKPEGDYVVDHIDGNKLNNFPNNLQYITRGNNVKKAVEQGFHVCVTPERIGSYIDGRSSKENKKQYKHDWYLQNKEKSIQRAKDHYMKKKLEKLQIN